MAIDTENKRRAVIQIIPLATLPVSDGTIDDDDRRMITGVYPGTASVGVGGVGGASTASVVYSRHLRSRLKFR